MYIHSFPTFSLPVLGPSESSSGYLLLCSGGGRVEYRPLDTLPERREKSSLLWGRGFTSADNEVQSQWSCFSIILWGKRQEPSVEMALTWCCIFKQSLLEAFSDGSVSHKVATKRVHSTGSWMMPLRWCSLSAPSLLYLAPMFSSEWVLWGCQIFCLVWTQKILLKKKTHSFCPFPSKVLTLLKLVEWLWNLKYFTGKRGKPQIHTGHCDSGLTGSKFLAVVGTPEPAARVK